jgi:hypothetical protein
VPLLDFGLVQDVASGVCSIGDNAVLHEFPIKAIDLVGLLRGEVRIAQSPQLITTGLYIVAVNNGTHRQLVTCRRVSQSHPDEQRRVQDQNSHAAA